MEDFIYLMKTIPLRKDVKQSDKWDLTSLFKTEQDWEFSLSKITEIANKISEYQGQIKDSAQKMLEVLKLNEEMEQIAESVGSYAFLLTTTDAGDSTYQDKQGRYMMAAVEAQTKTCFIVTEIQEIPEDELKTRMNLPDYAAYKIFLEKLLHQKPYILSEKEERLFALQAESSGTAKKAFSMLTNVDMDFGTVKTSEGELPLTQTTYSSFMENPDRNIRKEAYTKFYKTFDNHKNTIATLYAGNVQQDIYHARARGYKSSLQMALYPDNVPEEVYRNLISTVRENLSTLHKFYSLRKKILKLDELRHYDVYVPLVSEIKCTTPYEEAVEILRNALSPLGKDYTDILCNGLLNGWVDRYENKGKRSGAFSAGAYTGYPYILLNYKEDVLRDVFTMAHEGGHSMHSYFSAKSNPFMCYDYTIFEAEVASTFNEQLLFEYLLKNTTDEKMKAYLLCTRASDVLATLHRQTMFAEYELKAHELVENGTPLSVEVLRSEYRKLLQDYFGPEMVFEEESDLEGLRIPHFYNSFYVYKYSTGISAALALSDRVLNGGKSELEDYYKFLKSGGSRYPIDSLKLAGVDMSKPEPIQAALNKFADLVEQISNLKI